MGYAAWLVASSSCLVLLIREMSISLSASGEHVTVSLVSCAPQGAEQKTSISIPVMMRFFFSIRDKITTYSSSIVSRRAIGNNYLAFLTHDRYTGTPHGVSILVLGLYVSFVWFRHEHLFSQIFMSHARFLISMTCIRNVVQFRCKWTVFVG